jgi:hypothetical protein
LSQRANGACKAKGCESPHLNGAAFGDECQPSDVTS